MYVLIVSPNNFPENDAGAVRDGCFAKIYQELGYDVVHIGMNPDSEKGSFKGVRYYSIYQDNCGIARKISNSFSYGERLSQVMKKIIKNSGKPSVIHMYDIPKSGIELLRKYSIKNNIRIVHDSVEWYSPCEFKMGCFAYPYLLKNRTNTKLIRKPMYVYAISRYLQEYYSEKGLKTLRVPVIMDSKEYCPKIVQDNVIKVVYAGSPAKKDYLKECIIAFGNLTNKERERMEFHIYGADENYVEDCLSEKQIPEIVAHGRVAREDVTRALAMSDFSILLRPANERYTKAGFPTKSVEAMMNGCAMICNLTSDLGMYLKDEKNSIIVENCSSEAMTQALRKVIKLNRQEINEVKENAHKTAKEYFDYRIWVSAVKEFIEG